MGWTQGPGVGAGQVGCVLCCERVRTRHSLGVQTPGRGGGSGEGSVREETVVSVRSIFETFMPRES